jgi:hypothetical protein
VEVGVEELFDWATFLRWALTTGLPLLVGVALSFCVEYIPRFDELPGKWKRLVFFGASLAVANLATALGVWTLQWPPTWADTWWSAQVAGVLCFASGTLAHTPKLPDFPKRGN